MYKLLKFVVPIIAGATLVFLSFFVNERLGAHLVIIYLSILMIYIFTLILFNFHLISLKVHKRYQRKDSINQWIDSSLDFDLLMLKLFSKTRNSGLIRNLKTIKSSLEHEFQGELESFVLFNAYLKAIEKDSFKTVYYRIILGVSVTLLVGFLTKKKWVISSIDPDMYSNSFLTSMSSLTIIAMGCITIAYFVLNMNENKQRITLIREIVEVCIEEKNSNKRVAN